MFSCLSILGKSVLIAALAAGLLTQFCPCCAFAIHSFSKVSATPVHLQACVSAHKYTYTITCRQCSSLLKTLKVIDSNHNIHSLIVYLHGCVMDTCIYMLECTMGSCVVLCAHLCVRLLLVLCVCVAIFRIVHFQILGCLCCCFLRVEEEIVHTDFWNLGRGFWCFLNCLVKIGDFDSGTYMDFMTF